MDVYDIDHEDVVECSPLTTSSPVASTLQTLQNEILDTSSATDELSTIQPCPHCGLLNETSRLSVEKYKNDPRAIHYYTGFDDYEHLCFFSMFLVLLLII